MQQNHPFYKSLLLLVGISLFTLTLSCNKNGKAESKTDSPATDSLSFLVMGDWGKDGGGFQKPVADQMDIYSKKFHAQFIITTGDNFYLYGVANTADAHWKASFEDIYNKEGHQIPWYPSLGNHDYGLNPQAQVEYSRLSNRWKMPPAITALKKESTVHTLSSSPLPIPRPL